MLDWLTGNNLPQFWKNYTALFDGDEKTKETKRYVVFDMETTGIDWKEDTITAIGAMGIKGNAIQVADFFEVYINQEKDTKAAPISNKAFRTETLETVVEAEALIRFINFIQDATLVSHNINLDIEMLNQALKRLDLGRIKNPIMDTGVLYKKWKGLPDDNNPTLDEICNALKISKSDRHTASGNAFTAALAFLKLKRKLDI
jgi:DNA polymerase-3 subunit epsilon